MSADFKDHFSDNSDQYLAYRPRYPASLFQQLSDLTTGHDCAWDCATGSGQAAQELGRFYARVIATDASQTQIKSAVRNSKVDYWVALAENSAIRLQSIDLVTVAQAMHWFDIDKFSDEVSRVLKPGGVLAAWTYGLTRVEPGIDELVNHLYGPVLEPYWPQERKMIENEYRDFRLPLPEIAMPGYEMTQQWSLPQFMGYLGTWSAIRLYRQQTDTDPLEVLLADFQRQWGGADTLKTITWPVVVRVWRKA